jgi:hypothetical protein
MREESMNGGSTRRLAGGEWSAVGKSDAKGKEDSAIRSFYSRRRGGGGLAAGPNIDVNNRHRGSPTAAAASDRVRTSPIPASLTGGATVG